MMRQIFSSDYIKYFLDCYNHPALCINSNGDIIDYNERAYAIYPFKKEAFINKDYLLIKYFNAMEIPISTLSELKDCLNDNTNNGLFLSVHHQTSIQWSTLKFSYDNTQFFYFLLGQNVTIFINYTLKEQALRETMIDSLPAQIFWKNTDLIYLGCNKAFLESLGLRSKQEVIGKTDFDLPVSQKDSIAYRAHDIEIIRSKKPKLSIIEEQTLSDGTKKYLSTSKVPLCDAVGNIYGVLAIYIDITELKKTETDLIISKEAAEAANVAKTAFIANMSHDIRTPLTGVIGLSDNLISSLENPEHKEDARMVHESGQQLLKMLNDILDDVKADNVTENDINLKTFNLHECIYDLVRLEKPTVKLRNLELKVNIDATVPPCIISDRKKIHRILLNLLGNAIKFTKTGHITIEISCIESKGEDFHLRFGIADTGIGIPKELQDKVFDRFFRVTPSYKGLYQGHGLGLHIVQSYVTLLGGRVSLTSEEGNGTTFYFDLNCKKGIDTNTQKNYLAELTEMLAEEEEMMPAVEAVAKRPDEIAPDGVNSHILLVEDQVTALKALQSMVAKGGYTFQSATTGEEAFSLATSASFDLIITDIGLPGISGIELTSLIRQWEKEHSKVPVPIIALTGHAVETAGKECFEAGINEVLTKPTTLDEIQRLVKKLIPEETIEEIKELSLPKPEQSSLGLDLPKSEEELFQLDNFPVFDAKLALKMLDRDLVLLFDSLKLFISDREGDFKVMQEAYTNKDWAKVEKQAHKIKGGLAYIGLERMKYACQYLERYYKVGLRDNLDKLYQQILAVNAQTIEVVKDWLSRYDF